MANRFSHTMVALATALTFAILGVAYGNISFKHVPLVCSEGSGRIYAGCLRGQYCRTNNTCAPLSEIVVSRLPRAVLPGSVRTREDSPFSTDGTCGKAYGGTICNPRSTVYNGGCCSAAGFCGSSSLYCGLGCQSGCAVPGVPPDPTAARSDGQCGKDFGGAICDPEGPFGRCCSMYGFCGSTEGHCSPANDCQSGCDGPAQTPTSRGEPVIQPVTSTSPPGATATASTTKDGTCGASNGHTICGDWVDGGCCSMYGYCGKTAAHCGEGCQSGDCLSAPAVTAPGPKAAPPYYLQGEFKVVGEAGVPAMHAALMPNGKVFFLDKVENYTQLTLPSGYYAYSSEYDPASNTVVGLGVTTNPFCSGGAFLPDGRIINVGGNGPLDFIDPTVGDGFEGLRYLSRPVDGSQDGQSWVEPGHKLASARWYASVQTMPNGDIFVASGSLNGLTPTLPENNNPTYEILNSQGFSNGVNVPMDILQKNQPYYMYPFIHLLKDGSLFVFTSKAAQQFNVGSNAVVQEYPDLPGDYRTYPNTGGSVLLPLSSANNWEADVVICGGGAYQDITSPTDASCGRISPLSTAPRWEMDSMPEGRGMVEGTLLPDGSVLWLNGGSRGAQGFGLMSQPTLEALLYLPSKPLGERWATLASSSIPRLYHSIALLLLDGTLLVAGSNPVEQPVLIPTPTEPYATEFRVEKFVPPYLQGDNANRRPSNIVLSDAPYSPGTFFRITFTAVAGTRSVSVALYHGGFITHSVHMNHRMAVLDTTGFVPGATTQEVTVSIPPNHNICPPGPYVVYVLTDGVPGIGQFVTVT